MEGQTWVKCTVGIIRTHLKSHLTAMETCHRNIILSALLLCICTVVAQADSKTFTVNYYKSNGTTLIKSQSVSLNEGETFTAPSSFKEHNGDAVTWSTTSALTVSYADATDGGTVSANYSATVSIEAGRPYNVACIWNKQTRYLSTEIYASSKAYVLHVADPYLMKFEEGSTTGDYYISNVSSSTTYYLCELNGSSSRQIGRTNASKKGTFLVEPGTGENEGKVAIRLKTDSYSIPYMGIDTSHQWFGRTAEESKKFYFTITSAAKKLTVNYKVGDEVKKTETVYLREGGSFTASDYIELTNDDATTSRYIWDYTSAATNPRTKAFSDFDDDTYEMSMDVICREPQQYTYTVSLKAGEAVIGTRSATANEGETATAYIPKVVWVETEQKHYVLNSTYTSFSTTATIPYVLDASTDGNQTAEIQYTVDESIVFYAEGEKTEYFDDTYDACNGKYSDGGYGRILATKADGTAKTLADYPSLSLPYGGYTMETNIIDATTSGKGKRIIVRDADGDEIDRVGISSGTVYTEQFNARNTTNTFYLTGYRVGRDASSYFDYIIIRNTGKAGTYTVNFYYQKTGQDKVVIKDAVTHDFIYGDEVTASADETADFKATVAAVCADEQKFIYNKGNDILTPELDDAGNPQDDRTINLYFRRAGKGTLNVNAVTAEGTVLKENIGTFTEVYPGDEVNVKFPIIIKGTDGYYRRTSISRAATAKDKKSVNVPTYVKVITAPDSGNDGDGAGCVWADTLQYAKDTNIAYFSEFEKMTPSAGRFQYIDDCNTHASDNTLARVRYNSYVYTPEPIETDNLPASTVATATNTGGYYTLHLAGYGMNGRSEVYDLYLYDGNGRVTRLGEAFDGYWTTGSHELGLNTVAARDAAISECAANGTYSVVGDDADINPQMRTPVIMHRKYRETEEHTVKHVFIPAGYHLALMNMQQWGSIAYVDYIWLEKEDVSDAYPAPVYKDFAVTTAKWATFLTDIEGAVAPAGVDFYTVDTPNMETGECRFLHNWQDDETSDDGETAYVRSYAFVAANAPMIVNAPDITAKTFFRIWGKKRATQAATPTNGVLVGVWQNSNITGDGTQYILQKKTTSTGEHIGFYRITPGKTATLGAESAYMKLSSSDDAKFSSVLFGENGDSDDSSTDIGMPTASDSSVTAVYTTDGRLIDRPVRGVNIIRFADGTSRKVIVK